MHNKNDEKGRVFFFSLTMFHRKKKSSEIRTLGYMMLVTLNACIASFPIQMSSQSKFLKYFENLSKLFKFESIHPSNVDLVVRAGVGDREICVTGKLNREQMELFWGKAQISLPVFFFFNLTFKASINTILIFSWPTILSMFFPQIPPFCPFGKRIEFLY